MRGEVMARPKKCRRVCFQPRISEFMPDVETDCSIILTVDEYESIRLIDRLALSQEECAQYMQVARTTVQQIYNSARVKIATALVEGKRLRISGGDYTLCDGSAKLRACGGCGKSCKEAAPVISGSEGAKSRADVMKRFKTGTGRLCAMKIAVTYDNGQVFQHFGHTEQFKLYVVNERGIVSSEVVDTNGQGHGALAGFLAGAGADVLICGGIGGGARAALAEAGIELYGGVSGSCDAAVEAFISGKLNYDPDAECDHHKGQRSDEGHTCHGRNGHKCADHGCGGQGNS